MAISPLSSERIQSTQAVIASLWHGAPKAAAAVVAPVSEPEAQQFINAGDVVWVDAADISADYGTPEAFAANVEAIDYASQCALVRFVIGEWRGIELTTSAWLSAARMSLIVKAATTAEAVIA